MFIAALFATAKTWKQLKCSLTDKWRNIIGYTHTIECHSALRKGCLAYYNMDET